MTEIRGNLNQILKREAYIKDMRLTYGIIIEEYRSKDGQKCGYFHLKFPIFDKEQKPGDSPIGYTPPVTEYTEWVMKHAVSIVLRDEWYKNMCQEWANSHPITGENIWQEQ